MVIRLIIGVMSLVLTASAIAADDPELLRLGERLYRDGILPSGEPVQAFVKGDIPVVGTSFSCSSCHLRSGFGCVEGGVVTPPVTGGKLFQPYALNFKGFVQKYFPIPPRRPAYTDTTLATAIQEGIMPDGKPLNEVMPRYMMEGADMTILISYLKSLSNRVSPGVTTDTITFATIVGEDADAASRDQMLAILDRYVALKNGQAQMYQKPSGAKSRQMAEGMLVSKEMALRKIRLNRWVLKGAPDTWRSQLEEYRRKEPVFALLGGITGGDWQPVHRFCEENGIPCLFPLTDFPVVSGKGWYIMYFSKGFYQDGEGAARYLDSQTDAGQAVLQIVRNSRMGRAMSEGFTQTWQEKGHPAPVTLSLKEGETLTFERLRSLLRQHKPKTLVVWDDNRCIPLLEKISREGVKPSRVLASARYLGEALWELPEVLRGDTFLVFPYTFSQGPLRVASMGMGSAVPIPDDTALSISRDAMRSADTIWRVNALSDSIARLLTMALMDLWGNYVSDNFLDVIGMEPDQPSPVYGRLSFGPGQRFASKGSYIVQLASGSKPELIKKSGWLTH